MCHFQKRDEKDGVDKENFTNIYAWLLALQVVLLGFLGLGFWGLGFGFAVRGLGGLGVGLRVQDGLKGLGFKGSGFGV